MIHSPSSISAYKQCPRKYYYVYILGLEKKPTIHQVIGRMIHSVLDDFFNVDIVELEDYRERLQKHILILLNIHWDFKGKDIEGFNLSEAEKKYYFNESTMMLTNWLEHFLKKIENEMSKGFSFKDSFKRLTPQREQQFLSEKYGVQGYIDAIENFDGKIRLMDYKTSNNYMIDEVQRLQLAIYALLYKEKYDLLPHKVGVYFLRHTEQEMYVDQELLNQAISEIQKIHINTVSKDVKDYPKKESALCKWTTGKCDFYDTCMEQKVLS